MYDRVTIFYQFCDIHLPACLRYTHYCLDYCSVVTTGLALFAVNSAVLLLLADFIFCRRVVLVVEGRVRWRVALGSTCYRACDCRLLSLATCYSGTLQPTVLLVTVTNYNLCLAGDIVLFC